MPAGKRQSVDRSHFHSKATYFPPPDDSLAPALLQLYALACWRNSDYASAVVTIEKIETDYRTWKGFTETLYLKGEIFWKKRRFHQAWVSWSSLNDGFLSRIRNTTRTPNQKVPSDTLAAWKNQSLFSSVSVFSQWLASENTSTIVRNNGQPKIGIVLPFQLKESQKTKTSNAPMDFYRGMLLANEVCTASDSGLEFHVFDSKGSVQEIESMISKNTFSGLDALVGPLKFNHLKPLKDGANQLKIPLLIPFRIKPFPKPQHPISVSSLDSIRWRKSVSHSLHNIQPVADLPSFMVRKKTTLYWQKPTKIT